MPSRSSESSLPTNDPQSTVPRSHWLPPRAAYVHVPFCTHRCGYCNFTLVAHRDDLIDAYLEAIEKELSRLAAPHEVDTLYFGGGTPTHLPPAQLATLCETVLRSFPLVTGYEWTVEANPADLDEDTIEVLARFGVNRVSLGAQSFDPAKLAMLERDHQPSDIERSVRLIRSFGADVALDLIFAAPEESQANWIADLDAALALKPSHISTYGLTFERGTQFWNRLQKSELRQVDEQVERSMYIRAIDTLTAAGFEHYEISNFAQPQHRSRHNECYWSGDGYFAAGPGAARYVDGVRSTNHRSTTTWLQRVLANESPVAETESLSPEDRAREAFVFGLRRLEGVDRAEFSRRTGCEVDKLFGPPLGRYTDLGLLIDDGRRVRLSRDGLLVSDSLWPDFL